MSTGAATTYELEGRKPPVIECGEEGKAAAGGERPASPPGLESVLCSSTAARDGGPVAAGQGWRAVPPEAGLSADSGATISLDPGTRATTSGVTTPRTSCSVFVTVETGADASRGSTTVSSRGCTTGSPVTASSTGCTIGRPVTASSTGCTIGRPAASVSPPIADTGATLAVVGEAGAAEVVAADTGAAAVAAPEIAATNVPGADGAATDVPAADVAESPVIACGDEPCCVSGAEAAGCCVGGADAAAGGGDAGLRTCVTGATTCWTGWVTEDSSDGESADPVGAGPAACAVTVVASATTTTAAQNDAAHTRGHQPSLCSASTRASMCSGIPLQPGIVNAAVTPRSQMSVGKSDPSCGRHADHRRSVGNADRIREDRSQ